MSHGSINLNIILDKGCTPYVYMHEERYNLTTVQYLQGDIIDKHFKYKSVKGAEDILLLVCSCQFVEETLSAQYLNNPFWDYFDISYIRSMGISTHYCENAILIVLIFHSWVLYGLYSADYFCSTFIAQLQSMCSVWYNMYEDRFIVTC